MLTGRSGSDDREPAAFVVGKRERRRARVLAQFRRLNPLGEKGGAGGGEVVDPERDRRSRQIEADDLGDYSRPVARVVFTANLQRHVPCPPVTVDAATVGEALALVFTDNPRLRSYVVDERGALRKHMAVFVDGELIDDREHLGDPVGPEAEIYVMQALSGG